MVKRRKISTPTNEQPAKCSDLGTPELHKRSGGIEVTLNPHTSQLVGRIRTQRPIDYYYNKEYIDDFHYEAARCLSEDYFLMQSFPVRSSMWVAKGGKEFRENKIDAEMRYNNCMKKLDEAEIKLIHRIVLDDMYLKDFREEFSKYGMLAMATVQVLRETLYTVAKFYGLIS